MLGETSNTPGPNRSEVERYAGPSDKVIGPIGRDVLDLLVEHRKSASRLATKVAELDTSGEWGLDGSVSCQAWLRRHGRMTASAASSRVRTARKLRELPAVAKAFANGEIGDDHVRVIANGTTLGEDLPAGAGIDKAEVAHLVAASEKTFVDAARELDPAHVRRVVTHWRHAVEPETVVKSESESVRRRRLHLSQTLRGRWILTGELDPEGGVAVKTALDALSGPDPIDRPARSAPRKRADALVELAGQALDRGEMPTSGGERPHVSVIVELPTLERRAADRAASPPAHLEHAGPLSGEAARRLACDAGITRLITDGASLPLDVGRKTASIPVHIRKALVVRDRGCAWPGCDRPPGWTDAHHIVHWANGGSTSLGNLALLCRSHHRRVHEGHWTARLTDDGHLEVEPP